MATARVRLVRYFAVGADLRLGTVAMDSGWHDTLTTLLVQGGVLVPVESIRGEMNFWVGLGTAGWLGKQGTATQYLGTAAAADATCEGRTCTEQVEAGKGGLAAAFGLGWVYAFAEGLHVAFSIVGFSERGTFAANIDPAHLLLGPTPSQGFQLFEGFAFEIGPRWRF